MYYRNKNHYVRIKLSLKNVSLSHDILINVGHIPEEVEESSDD